MDIKVLFLQPVRLQVTYDRGKRYIRVRFWSDTGHIKGRIFRCVLRYTSEILSTVRFDKSTDLSTTYLGKADRSKDHKIKGEESFCIVIVDIHRHGFEIYTLVSEIHENIDLVIGIKNVFELERVYKLMRLLFQIFKQIPTHFPQRTYCGKT